MVSTMKYSSIAAPLLVSPAVHTQMRRVGQSLLDALTEEEALYQEQLGDEDIGRWKKSKKAIEQLAVDYIAMVRLYLEAVTTVLPKSSN
jgi:hypothetical protein